MTDDPKSEAAENLPSRQNLVDTAVSFLLNPNVKQKPDDAKIAFLKKKGLTDSEIAESFSRVQNETVISNEDQQLINAYPLPPYRTSRPFWFYLRSYSSAFVSFAVAAYVLHRFYKSYIEPWLFGSKSDELSALKQQLIELNKSVSQLSSSVSSLEETVNNQKLLMERCYLYDVESVPKSVREILDEVSNVKGLLLNRYSFPAPPSLVSTIRDNKQVNGEPAKVVTIPKWQLRDIDIARPKVPSPDSFSQSTSSESSSSSGETNVKVAKDDLQKEESGLTLEVKNENSLCTNGNIQEGDSETDVHNRDVEGKTLDEDSGVESQNYVSDPESTEQTSVKNENQESTQS